jgi:hypothetical protein
MSATHHTGRQLRRICGWCSCQLLRLSCTACLAAAACAFGVCVHLNTCLVQALLATPHAPGHDQLYRYIPPADRACRLQIPSSNAHCCCQMPFGATKQYSIVQYSTVPYQQYSCLYFSCSAGCSTAQRSNWAQSSRSRHSTSAYFETGLRTGFSHLPATRARFVPSSCNM